MATAGRGIPAPSKQSSAPNPEPTCSAPDFEFLPSVALVSGLGTRRLSGPKRVQGMRCKNADAHQKQYSNNNIHDATLTMASGWARRCFRSVSFGPKNGFVRPPG